VNVQWLRSFVSPDGNVGKSVLLRTVLGLATTYDSIHTNNKCGSENRSLGNQLPKKNMTVSAASAMAAGWQPSGWRHTRQWFDPLFPRGDSIFYSQEEVGARSPCDESCGQPPPVIRDRLHPPNRGIRRIVGTHHRDRLFRTWAADHNSFS
jgi:hypothetical protein